MADSRKRTIDAANLDIQPPTKVQKTDKQSVPFVPGDDAVPKERYCPNTATVNDWINIMSALPFFKEIGARESPNMETMANKIRDIWEDCQDDLETVAGTFVQLDYFVTRFFSPENDSSEQSIVSVIDTVRKMIGNVKVEDLNDFIDGVFDTVEIPAEEQDLRNASVELFWHLVVFPVFMNMITDGDYETVNHLVYYPLENIMARIKGKLAYRVNDPSILVDPLDIKQELLSEKWDNGLSGQHVATAYRGMITNRVFSTPSDRQFGTSFYDYIATFLANVTFLTNDIDDCDLVKITETIQDELQAGKNGDELYRKKDDKEASKKDEESEDESDVDE